VILVNEKKEEKGRATTDDTGFFRIENVPPGKYKVTVTKPATKRKGEVPVQIESGKTAKVEVSLHV
jgi:Carboxypeptidase regulatory-like domain